MKTFWKVLSLGLDTQYVPGSQPPSWRRPQSEGHHDDTDGPGFPGDVKINGDTGAQLPLGTQPPESVRLSTDERCFLFLNVMNYFLDQF